MKRLSYDLDRYQAALFTKPIRSKEDIILLWMHALKLMLAYVAPEEIDKADSMHLHVDKMSRLFFRVEGKTFSVNFPFFLRENDGDLTFSNQSCPKIDSRISSVVIGFLTHSRVFTKTAILDFSEPILDSSDWHATIWDLFRDLMLAEDGYLRVDHDPERMDGHRHPLDHVDIFYSSSSTLKIGLSTSLSVADFVDLVDGTTDCHYLRRP